VPWQCLLHYIKGAGIEGAVLLTWGHPAACPFVFCSFLEIMKQFKANQ
jgi:hypothetical protein